MFFRNLTFFRFPVSHDTSTLEQQLPLFELKPVGALEMTSRGFVSPFGRDSDVFLHSIGKSLWLAVGTENKILPGSVVNDLLAKKMAEIEEKQGYKPTGRNRKRLKEDLIHELLPRAFVKTSKTDAFLDLDLGIIAVNCSSHKSGEAVVSDIRTALGSFPALPLNTEIAARTILTRWVAGEDLPDGLALGEECELKDPNDNGAIIKCQRQELICDEIKQHLQAGKQVTKLALILNDTVSFVLGDDLIIRKLKFLEGAVDELESTDFDDIRAELDAKFALFSGEVKRLFIVLENAFKLSKPV